MVGRNSAALIAQIGQMTRPKVTEGKSIDIAGAVDAYFKGKELAEKQQQKQNLEDLTTALQGGNEEEIGQAYAKADPIGYNKYLQNLKQANLQREQAVADEELKHQRSLELEKVKNANTKEVQNYNYLISQGKTPEEALSLAFGKNALVNINTSPFEKKRIEKIASQMDEKISESTEKLGKLEQIKTYLNSPDVNTGGTTGLAKEYAPNIFLSTDEQNLRTLINEMLPRMRAPGSGSTSDKDMEIFKKGTVGFSKDKQANLNIVEGSLIAEQNNIAKEELRAEYISSGMGNSTQFDKEWREYLNKNPIFANEKAEFNKNRIDPYSWFAGERTVKNTNMTQDPRIQQALDAGYSMEEINAYLGR
jgi:hypothetical protein